MRISVFPRTWIGWSAWLCCAAGSLWAQEAPVAGRAAAEVVVRMPLDDPALPPERFYARPHQARVPSGNAVEFFLLPAGAAEELFVTLVFRDSDSAALAVYWLDVQAGTRTLLSENLAEGVAGLNQRTLRIPKELLAHAGQLLISGQTADLLQLGFQWLQPSAVFSGKDGELATLVMSGRIIGADELAGKQNLAPPDAWFDSVLEASLQQSPESLAGGLEFIVPLGEMPERTLIKAKFLNLPLNRKVQVWINGEFAGEFVPATPPLTDPGYVKVDGTLQYAGWRGGSLLLPVNQFLVGENSIILKSAEAGVFIRDAALQLKGETGPAPAKTSLPAGQMPGSESSLLTFP